MNTDKLKKDEEYVKFLLDLREKSTMTPDVSSLLDLRGRTIDLLVARNDELVIQRDEQAVIIREKNAIIAELERDRKRLLREEERSAWLETILRYVMYKIALGTIIFGTHRERTSEMSSLVKDINFKMSIWSMNKSEMDDIPF